MKKTIFVLLILIIIVVGYRTIKDNIPVRNLLALCQSDKEKFIAEKEIEWNNLQIQTTKEKGGKEVLRDYSAYLQAQHKAMIDLHAASREQYCIEHNRHYEFYVEPTPVITSPFE